MWPSANLTPSTIRSPNETHKSSISPQLPAIITQFSPKGENPPTNMASLLLSSTNQINTTNNAEEKGSGTSGSARGKTTNSSSGREKYTMDNSSALPRKTNGIDAKQTSTIEEHKETSR
ncbi:hypothetical protein EB796_018153 [Bugula neritina]|uniref:Uncharacterized protein n=1 Tax=Bugula neritina TaxID=10212 RepID=A0A7J7JD38_BUGNE|nr:hypothetical protein EB796_018153 [Bugula neritina]